MHAKPILKSFSIKGLHGYKDVEVQFEGPARIVVAENGSGKTTIFNALNSVVSRKFQRLSKLRFDSITLSFCETGNSVEIRKDQLSRSSDSASDLISQLTDEAGVDPSELTAYLQDSYIKGEYARHMHSHIINRIYLGTAHDHDSLAEVLDNIYDLLDSGDTGELQQAKQTIASEFKDVETLYLPTYRRIELPLSRDIGRKNRSEQRFQRVRREAAGSFGVGGLRVHNINFGLSDVVDTLATLTEEVEKRSNQEYRAISATILDEILRDQVETSSGAELPDIESLSRFLSRVGRQDQAHMSIEAIRRLYTSGEISNENKLWLRYFLGRLNRVISRTREIELKLEQFVEVCNQYLGSSSDEKQLMYDPQEMQVVVKSQWTELDIPLDDLSSGEKQIISMLAKLYLSDSPKFVMIDEPELSLSLDWQRRILPDFMNSGSVMQLFAITHSPFIFDNVLDPVAGPMLISRRKGQK